MVGAHNRWEPALQALNLVLLLTPFNGQIGTVVLNADDIDDSSTVHKFAMPQRT